MKQVVLDGTWSRVRVPGTYQFCPEQREMNSAREETRLGPGEGRQSLTLQVDGEPVLALTGQTVATVLLTLGRRAFRHTDHGAPRGIFCGMGVCFDCLVTVDGVENVRACLTTVAEGMVIDTRGRSYG